MAAVCVLPLLTLVLGYLLLHLPEINRALWQSATQAAHLTAGAHTGHKYAAATADSAGAALALMSIAGSLYVAVGLVRRATAVGLRWSDGHPRRRFLAILVAAACSAGSRARHAGAGR